MRYIPGATIASANALLSSSSATKGCTSASRFCIHHKPKSVRISEKKITLEIFSRNESGKDWRILVDLQLFAVAGVLAQAQVEVLVLVQALLSPLLLAFRVPLDLLDH
jgi:hypothetical protein